MRRLVVALVVALLAFSLVACGGGGGDAASTEQAAEDVAAEAPPAPPAATGADVESDRSPTEVTEVAPFPTGSSVATIVPTAVMENLEGEQAQLIYFYDSTQPETADVRAEIDAALDDYRGLVALVSFDMAKAAPSSKAGDPELAKAALLADFLKVANTPFILLVDGQGLMTWRWRGPVDAGIIDRELRRATG
ncbi:MAG: hypothetical protein C0418_01670 [Coriobacteriaceae bacterium]|nr:hypothetical protein [Coriobacteriaceae bacterium]